MVQPTEGALPEAGLALVVLAHHPQRALAVITAASHSMVSLWARFGDRPLSARVADAGRGSVCATHCATTSIVCLGALHGHTQPRGWTLTGP